MAALDDVKRSCAVMEAAWASNGVAPGMVLLHCVSAYPAPLESANLLAIRSLERDTGYPVGYSDHTLGIEAAVLSVALGARVIEKHFTLSKTQSSFRDHQLSADPVELAELVRRVKLARAALGDGVKRMMPAEQAVAAAARRSAVAPRASRRPCGRARGPRLAATRRRRGARRRVGPGRPSAQPRGGGRRSDHGRHGGLAGCAGSRVTTAAPSCPRLGSMPAPG
jgi:hypothetical protein